MGSNPINLILRFFLEIASLAAAGMWGWKHGDGLFRYVLAFGIPIVLTIIWGTFAVPNDPSRSGSAPVVTPGLIRLAIEFGFFAFATWCLYDSGLTMLSLTFGIIVLLHYLVSYDRIVWLLSN